MKNKIISIVSFVLCLNVIITAQTPIITDPLTSNKVVSGEATKKNEGGQFSAKGWQALKDGDYLRIELANAQGLEGKLEIDITDWDWEKSSSAGGQEKFHFLGMFSNPLGELHKEGGGTDKDALWSLRGGMGEGKKPRFGNNFKLHLSAKGAERTTLTDYREGVVTVPTDWQWNKPSYTFKVIWNNSQGKFKIYINNTFIYETEWTKQVEPLKYIYIGKSFDFGTCVGPFFTNLKVYN